ncbi:hypothetical protein J4438_02310 [Candidatus Woesearchaeota archaeon]|nr:hypothetical protein [Candidatus Woesearchaeota archaeon]
MPEKDKVVKELIIKQKAQFNMLEFYKFLSSWFEVNRYIFYETNYDDTRTDDKKSLKIKWNGSKDVDDYYRFSIKVTIELKNYEMIETEKEKLVDGELKVELESTLILDYEEKWQNNPTMKFLRSTADKFFFSSKHEKYIKELRNDTYDVFDKIKSFLNLQKFR